MADEAFALSPISARAALPGEEDYAAISEAFMETSRGRWFLTEYAKRNRNADTRMVLDAVARIEQSLAAQKEESQVAQRDSLAAQLAAQREALSAQQQAMDAAAAKSTASAAAAVAAAMEAADHRLKATLAAIRTAVETAQAAATEALDGLALEQRQAAVRKGSRVLREIAWRLREIGNDGRICDLIDSQVAVIEKASEEITTEEAKVALGAVFAQIGGRLAEFGDRAPAPAAEAPAAEMPPEAMAETVETSAVLEAAEASATAFAEPAEAVHPATVHTEAAPAETSLAEAAPTAAPMETEAALASDETFEVTDVTDNAIADETAAAEDEAILDMIAMEMGAPDPIDDDEIAAAMAEPVHLTEPAPVEQAIVEVPEPVAAILAPPVEMPPQPAAVAAPAVEMSLGSSILASGMFSKPAKPANDPLAPIRRMSQVEKIAFFS